MKNLRRLIEKEVHIVVHAEQDDIPVRGNALASGDDAEDKKAEDEIIDRLENGDEWAWASVQVTGLWRGLKASEYLGACSYESERDFVKNSGYYDDMKATVIDELVKMASNVRKNPRGTEDYTVSLGDDGTLDTMLIVTTPDGRRVPVRFDHESAAHHRDKSGRLTAKGFGLLSEEAIDYVKDQDAMENPIAVGLFRTSKKKGARYSAVGIEGRTRREAKTMMAEYSRDMRSGGMFKVVDVKDANHLAYTALRNPANRDVAKAFAAGATKGKGYGNVYIQGDTIYSYGPHFPIATWITPDIVAMTTRGYSVSTSKHKSYVRGALAMAGVTVVYSRGVANNKVTAPDAADLAEQADATAKAALLASKREQRRLAKEARKSHDLRDAAGVSPKAWGNPALHPLYGKPLCSCAKVPTTEEMNFRCDSCARQMKRTAPWTCMSHDVLLCTFCASGGKEMDASELDNPRSLGPCSCRPGQDRDNCPACEGTGRRIDFAAHRAQKLRCPKCGTSESVTPPFGHKLAKCDACHTAFDTMDNPRGEGARWMKGGRLGGFMDSAARTARLHPARPHKKPYGKGACGCGGVPVPLSSAALSDYKRRVKKILGNPAKRCEYCGIPMNTIQHEEMLFQNRCPSTWSYSEDLLKEKRMRISHPNPARTLLGRKALEIKMSGGHCQGNFGACYGLADGSTFIKGLFTKVPGGRVQYISYMDEAKAKREGMNPPDRPWKHDFSSLDVIIVRCQGGVVLKSKSGTPLWGHR